MSTARQTIRSRRRRTPWRENIEALAVAVVMAVFLKYFIVEAYKIPTGSMQPTLMGQPLPDGGGIFDRILVDKLSYHVRAPKRFEVVVFKYPLDRSKNFVKRLWGLPGEQLRIAYGDVWVRDDPREPWRIPRRPTKVQRESWKAIEGEAGDARPSWQVLEGSWRAEGRQVEARGAGRARFQAHGAGAILDRYLDGYPEAIRSRLARRSETGSNPVGDLRLAGRVRALPGCVALAVELSEGPRRYRLELPGPAAPADASPRVIVLSGDGVAQGGLREARGDPWRLPAGRWVGFAGQNLDDRLELEIEGRTRVALEIAPSAEQEAQVVLTLVGEGADLERLEVSRDIFYTTSRAGRSQWSIPEGHYFMLGDNTQDSSDSREWTLVDVSWEAPDGSRRSVLGNDRPAGAPDANPITWPSAEGSHTWVRDEWGEVHVFPASRESTSPNARRRIERATVPLELITGRAVLVFWPIAPRLGLWRLRWVH